MWFDRRMLGIQWTMHMTNEEVTTRTATKLLFKIRKQQMEFLWHANKKAWRNKLSHATPTKNKRKETTWWRSKYQKKKAGVTQEKVLPRVSNTGSCGKPRPEGKRYTLKKKIKQSIYRLCDKFYFSVLNKNKFLTCTILTYRWGGGDGFIHFPW